MAIPVVCPGCGSHLDAPDTAAGQTVVCSTCQASVPVPEPSSFEAAPNEVEPRPKRRPRYEHDEEDREEPREVPPIPGIVRAAGIIWVGYGALGLFSTILSFVVEVGAKAGNAGANNPGGNASSPCCGIAIACAFAYCGLQTLKGESKDTLGNSIGSLILGSLQLLAGVVLVVLGAGGIAGNLPIDPGVIFLIAAIAGFFGCMLVLAGILGLIGRSAYREWREIARPRKRRRRRRDEDDDAD